MDTHSPVPQEIWDRTPPEAPAYILHLEARVAAPVAIANAVMDALSHVGGRHLDTPLTPEKIWRALQGAQWEILPHGIMRSYETMPSIALPVELHGDQLPVA